jgi:hypothetical protein
LFDPSAAALRARTPCDQYQVCPAARPEPARLGAGDLAILGRYLFGPRWKAALARELGVSDRIVMYWASAQRPTSRRCSTMTVALVQGRRASRLAAVQQGYAAMVCALSAPPAALAITTEVVPPYLVPRPLAQPLGLPLAVGKSAAAPPTPLETVAAHYEARGLVAIAASLLRAPVQARGRL